VLYDALNYPLLLNTGSFQLFANEAVLGVIEVKSRLNNPKRLSEGLENIASSKVLLKFPPNVEYPETLGIIFCYEAWKRPGTLIRNLRNAIEDNYEHLPDLICCLDPGYLLVAARLLGKSVVRLGTPVAGMERDDVFLSDEFVLIRPLLSTFREHILLWFYLLLIDYLNRSLNIGVNMAQYIRSSSAWRRDSISLREAS